MRFKTYYHYWLVTAVLSIQSSFENRLGVVFFLIGKILRFALFIVFIALIGNQVESVEGYSFNQLVVVYLVFNLFDIFGQLFFRGIYWFRQQIVSGEFDFRLVKPLNPLFQALTRQTDILDVPLLLIVIIALFYYTPPVSLATFILFLILSLGAILMITALHIVIASLGVLTTEVDHTIMIYRDISAMARFPTDIYGNFIRSLLTFAIPITLIFNYPAQALLGLLTPAAVVIVMLAAVLVLSLSLRLWRFALTRYTSASS